MIKEHDRVALTCDLPEHGLRAGDVGTVVHLHKQPGYEVEFMTFDGETIAIVSLAADQVRAIGSGQIANARDLEGVR